MAETDDGKKVQTVKEYKRTKPGGTYKKVMVKQYQRSTPSYQILSSSIETPQKAP